MSKFKVGDKVRRIRFDSPSGVKIGDICTVKEVTGYIPRTFLLLEGYGRYPFSSDYFELVESGTPQSGVNVAKWSEMRYYGTIYHVNGTLFVGPYSSMEEVMKWLDLESRPLVVQSRSIVIKDV